jgi:hypothetical protein
MTDGLIKNRINDLAFILQSNEVFTDSGNSIRFFPSVGQTLDHGDILVDNSKRGHYQIYCYQNLRLILSSIDNFKFNKIGEYELPTIIVEGVLTQDVLTCLKRVSISY